MPEQPTNPSSSSKNAVRVVFWPVLLIVVAFFAYRVMVETPPTITPRLTFITADSTPYWDAVLDGARAAADVQGVDLEVVTPDGTLAAQESLLSNFDASGRDGIAISPVDAARQTIRLRRLAEGAAVVTVDSDSELSNRICFVGMNNLDAGRRAARLISDLLPGGGRVLILAGPLDKANGLDRREGLLDELLGREHVPTREPTEPGAVLGSDRFTVGPTLLDDIDAKAAADQLVEYLSGTSDRPDCIVGLYGYHAPAIVEALKQVDNTDAIRVIGFDTVPETLEAMAAGDVHGIIAQDRFSYGYESIRILAEAVRGADYALPMNRRVEYPPVVVTPETLESFLRDEARARTGG